MLKIFLLIYFIEAKKKSIIPTKNSTKIPKYFLFKKSLKETKNTVYSKIPTSSFIENKKHKYFTGRTFENYYCDLKIAENKVSLNYNSMELDVLSGTFFQKNGCLVLVQNPKKFFFYDRKNFFNVKNKPACLINKAFNLSILEKFITSGKNRFFIFKNFNFFTSSKSRLNSGLLEKIWNIKLNNSENYELFYKKKETANLLKFRLLKNSKNIELRRNRIFNLKILPIFFKKNLDGKNSSIKIFHKGILKSVVFLRFFLRTGFYLSPNIVFFKKGVLYDINNGIFGWFLQLENENHLKSLNTYPFSKYFRLKGVINSQLIHIFNGLISFNKKKFNTDANKTVKSFSLLKNDLSWNITFSLSEISLDFLVKPVKSNFIFNAKIRWEYLTQLVLFYFFYTQNDIYLVQIKFKKIKKFRCFNFKSNSKTLDLKSWKNIVFDTTNFFKKKNQFKSGSENFCNLLQTNKINQFLDMKNHW